MYLFWLQSTEAPAEVPDKTESSNTVSQEAVVPDEASSPDTESDLTPDLDPDSAPDKDQHPAQDPDQDPPPDSAPHKDPVTDPALASGSDWEDFETDQSEPEQVSAETES